MRRALARTGREGTSKGGMAVHNRRGGNPGCGKRKESHRCRKNHGMSLKALAVVAGVAASRRCSAPPGFSPGALSVPVELQSDRVVVRTAGDVASVRVEDARYADLSDEGLPVFLTALFAGASPTKGRSSETTVSWWGRALCSRRGLAWSAPRDRLRRRVGGEELQFGVLVGRGRHVSRFIRAVPRNRLPARVCNRQLRSLSSSHRERRSGPGRGTYRGDLHATGARRDRCGDAGTIPRGISSPSAPAISSMVENPEAAYGYSFGEVRVERGVVFSRRRIRRSRAVLWTTSSSPTIHWRRRTRCWPTGRRPRVCPRWR